MSGDFPFECSFNVEVVFTFVRAKTGSFNIVESWFADYGIPRPLESWKCGDIDGLGIFALNAMEVF